MFKVLILGSKDTPYAYGAFVFDVWFQPSYPSDPPHIVIKTGRNKVRFNPNLYLEGKVCLSLLNTWGGDSYQKWIPEKSSLLQVLLSIQSLVMHEDVYFNEPAHYTSKGQPVHDSRNEAYCKLVKYANIQYAMVEAIQEKDHPFKEIILAHFYLNRENIFQQIDS